MISFYLLAVLLIALLIAVVVAGVRSAVPARERLDREGPAAPAPAARDILQALEFEYRTGKISREEYDQLRARLARAAIASRDSAGARERSAPDSDAGAAEPERCPSCGGAIGPGDRYCGSCGARLSKTHDD